MTWGVMLPREGKSVICTKCTARLVSVRKGLFKRRRMACINKLCNKKYLIIG